MTLKVIAILVIVGLAEGSWYHGPSGPALIQYPADPLYHWYHTPHVITKYQPIIIYKEAPTTTTTPAPDEDSSLIKVGADINTSSSAERSQVIKSASEDNDASRIPPADEENDSSKIPPETPEAEYLAKTLGTEHTAPLQGYLESVKILNLEPAPGTSGVYST